ncbi:MAG: flavodoxin family protein [Candidatus Heimdallarchaeota archaeon]
MKIIILHGSPRKNKNSDTLVRYFIRGMNKNKKHQINHFYLNTLNISPCQGCLSCETSINHRCAIQDDMQEIYDAYINADIIVFATPMYWGYMTAQLKIAIDRMEALAWEHFYHKHFVVIITYRHHYESTAVFFKRIAPFFDLELDFVICQTYDTNTQKDIPIENLKEKLEEAYNLGVKIAS